MTSTVAAVPYVPGLISIGVVLIVVLIAVGVKMMKRK
jgi:hypothetical protein